MHIEPLTGFLKRLPIRRLAVAGVTDCRVGLRPPRNDGGEIATLRSNDTQKSAWAKSTTQDCDGSVKRIVNDLL